MLEEFFASLDAEWFRDLMTDLFLLALTIGLGGLAVSKLQAKWATARGRAEAEWQHQRELYTRVAAMLQTLSQAEQMFQPWPVIWIDPGPRERAAGLVSEACVEASQVMFQLDIAYPDIPDEAKQLAARIASLGEADLEEIHHGAVRRARDDARELLRTLRHHMHYGPVSSKGDD